MSCAHFSLTTDLLLSAYRRGIFPMADDAGRITWHDPDPRAVFDLERLTIPSRLARYVRANGFAFRIDMAFGAVIRGCAEREPRWISEEMIHVYSELHRLGHAHSVEVWNGGSLLGGIYGIAIRGAFFGESMFSCAPNASKAAFFHLAAHLRSRGFILFDTQYLNAHTASLGAFEIPRQRFRAELMAALELSAEF
ncbi:MAG: leucyl/phenylalanyl-tRNA--protein transferase [Flavobacteriales bacterium]|nr:leucyl/phenylalanyl-tRNA--protein transferase [Flavobacteriales bacterium]MBK6752834.1 leucyl/phenylalanyl-tRNA--protein transferase [Flavobacteriales bacterium]MBK9075828.1 leucyl/phenylalanyl-tRNA--protein transferase [Flavobacteriales bacterium]MBK9537404.1 leucyl/phenylalanyl-tRNA--protein transferase [Flavobacteriales bacterium]